MKEPTHFDMCRILSSGKCADFFKYINEVLINNDKIKIIRSHPELGLSFDELKVLLEFAQRIKCSFFISTVQK